MFCYFNIKNIFSRIYVAPISDFLVKMSKTVEITNDDTGEYDCTRKFRGLNQAEENGQKPVSISGTSDNNTE